MKPFVAPQASLGALDALAAAELIAASADIALVLDGRGTVQDLAITTDELLTDLPDSGDWRGHAFPEIVAPDSRTKAESLLRGAGGSGPRWRHLNHLAPDGRSVPVLYCIAPLPAATGKARLVAFGRDQRATTSLQQRLIDAQQGMEREYARLRDADLRYRLLFQLSGEPVLVVEVGRGRVVEANPAARAQLAGGADLAGRTLADLFRPDGLRAIQGGIEALRAGGRMDEVAARTMGDDHPVVVRMSLFRQEGALLALLRLAAPAGAVPAAGVSPAHLALLRVIEAAPDAHIVTDEDGSVLLANAAFLELAQIMHEDEAVGQPLDRWLGESGVDLGVLSANLRTRGAVRFFSSTVRGRHGTSAPVEVSAVAVPREDADGLALGFALRNVGNRLTLGAGLAAAPPAGQAAPSGPVPRSVAQLTELIGRVPLKDLVRESTEVIERLAIEAALEITGDNRASAAEMLGLSRQSLYVKLRRYGIGDLSGMEGEG